MYKNMGTTNAGPFVLQGLGGSPNDLVLDDAGIASGGAFLVSELEKRDPMIRKPLTSVTYPRDIVIKQAALQTALYTPAALTACRSYRQTLIRAYIKRISLQLLCA